MSHFGPAETASPSSSRPAAHSWKIWSLYRDISVQFSWTTSSAARPSGVELVAVEGEDALEVGHGLAVGRDVVAVRRRGDRTPVDA